MNQHRSRGSSAWPLAILITIYLVSVFWTAGSKPLWDGSTWRSADTLSIPHTFSPNTLAKSSEVNANFTAVQDVVNGTIDDSNLKNAGITASTKLIDSTITLSKMGAASVGSSAIVDGTVAEADLDINNSAQDKYLLKWDQTAGKMVWHDTVTTCFGVIYSGLLTASSASTTFASIYQMDLDPGPATAEDARTSTTEATLELNWMAPVALTFHSLRVEVDVAPGAAASGKAWDVTLRKASTADLANTTCQIFENSTSCVSSGSDGVSAGDQLLWKVVPTATPDAPGEMRISVCYSPF